MGLRARILNILQPEFGGPRKRLVLEGLAKHYAYKGDFDALLRRMRDKGEIVMVGSKRGARYGLPKGKAA